MNTRTRGRDGKFVKTPNESEGELREERGFIEETKSLFYYAYKLWRVLPLLISIYLIWRYFKIDKKILELILELTCGEGCSCSCPSTSANKINATEASKSLKDLQNGL
jgi:hypothetical protein